MLPFSWNATRQASSIRRSPRSRSAMKASCRSATRGHGRRGISSRFAAARALSCDLMLFKLLGAPFTLPMAGLKFVFQQIADLADQELYDESVIREQLLLLQVQLEDGDIDEADYAEREAELLARMREIKARKRAEMDEAATDDLPAEANVEARRRVVIEVESHES